MFKHKFTFKTLLATPLLCLALIGCQNEELSTGGPDIPEEALETFNYLVEFEGYSPDKFTVDQTTKSLIYNQDIAIDFNTRANMLNAEQEAQDDEIVSKNQWMGSSGVLYSNSRNITYYFEQGNPNRDFDFPDEYKSAFGWAAYHWSRVSPNINFRRVYSRRDAQISLSGWTDRNDRAWARAQLPKRDGNVGAWVAVNRANALPTNPSETTKMTLMIHELGHSLGFQHSDQNFGNRIPGTRDYRYHAANNCGSIMKSSVYNCSWRSGSSSSAWTSDDWTSIHWAYRLYP